MLPANLPPPIFIARQPALQRLANALLREPQIAVDTESNSLYAYRERVCLIQFSTPQGDFIVDPLALEDLSLLAPVFSNPQCEKIFHAAEYDLICLKRDFGFEFGNLFDTMVATRILGREECGLGSILEEEFQVQLDKRLQRANWGLRPLPANLLTYARLDTHYLIALRDRLYGELEQSGRLPLAQEDFRRLCQANGVREENGPQEWWRVNGAHDLPAQNAAVLMELCRYREGVASTTNRPLFKVIGDKTLVAIAANCPKNEEQLSRLPGMSHLQIQRHGKNLLAAVRSGLAAPPAYPPRHKRPDEKYLIRLEALRTWRKSVAQKMGVSSEVVLPRDLLIRVAEGNPGDADEMEEILSDVPWRMEKFGGEILREVQRLNHEEHKEKNKYRE
jgi:ribonuclease D